MKRIAWRKPLRGFLTRLVIPLAVTLFFLLVLKMLAGTPPAPAKPQKPSSHRNAEPPARARLGRDFTKSEPTTKQGSM
jgi:hypothetical protein